MVTVFGISIEIANKGSLNNITRPDKAKMNFYSITNWV